MQAALGGRSKRLEKQSLRRGRCVPTGSRRWHGREKYQHSENRKSQLQSQTSSSSLAQRVHVTPCNPAQSKGKPERSRFSEVLMTFGNRFVAARCGNMAASVARSTGPPPARFARSLTMNRIAVLTSARVLSRARLGRRRRSLRAGGFDDGYRPSNPATHFFAIAMQAAGTRKLMSPDQDRSGFTHKISGKSEDGGARRMVGEEGLEPSKPYGG